MLCVCYSQNVSWILCCDSTTFLMLLSPFSLSFQIWPCCSTPSCDGAGRADGEASLEAEQKPSWEMLSWTSHVLLHLSCRYGYERLGKFSEQNYCLIKSVPRLCQISTSQCLWNVQPWPAEVTISTSLHPTSTIKVEQGFAATSSSPEFISHFFLSTPHPAAFSFPTAVQ